MDQGLPGSFRKASLSRGQQSNALKGIVGITAVLSGQPMVIETGGIRHQISAQLIADEVVVTHHQGRTPLTAGTRVTLTVDAAGQELDLRTLAAGYALANLRATIGVSVDEALSPAQWRPVEVDPLQPDR